MPERCFICSKPNRTTAPEGSSSQDPEKLRVLAAGARNTILVLLHRFTNTDLGGDQILSSQFGSIVEEVRNQLDILIDTQASLTALLAKANGELKLVMQQQLYSALTTPRCTVVRHENASGYGTESLFLSNEDGARKRREGSTEIKNHPPLTNFPGSASDTSGSGKCDSVSDQQSLHKIAADCTSQKCADEAQSALQSKIHGSNECLSSWNFDVDTVCESRTEDCGGAEQRRRHSVQATRTPLVGGQPTNYEKRVRTRRRRGSHAESELAGVFCNSVQPGAKKTQQSSRFQPKGAPNSLSSSGSPLRPRTIYKPLILHETRSARTPIKKSLEGSPPESCHMLSSSSLMKSEYA